MRRFCEGWCKVVEGEMGIGMRTGMGKEINVGQNVDQNVGQSRVRLTIVDFIQRSTIRAQSIMNHALKYFPPLTCA